MRYTERQMTSELLDRPAFVGEPRKLFICSTPRSGSYLLCRYMINAGLGVPHEYFNPIIMRQIAPRLGLGNTADGLKWRRPTPMDRLPFGKAARVAETDFLGRYVGPLIPRRCQGGVFAAKIHFEQYTKVLNNSVGWKLLEGGLFVYLYREDLLKQAVSTHFAFLTGRWGIDDDVTTTPESRPDFFDSVAIDRALEMLANEDLGWRIFFAQNGIQPIFMSYEQLCTDPFGFVILLAKHLEIDPGTLRRGYDEAGSHSENDPGIPSKSEVARGYLTAVRKLSAGSDIPRMQRG
jgi:LPS sulfotransferase NodH